MLRACTQAKARTVLLKNMARVQMCRGINGGVLGPQAGLLPAGGAAQQSSSTGPAMSQVCVGLLMGRIFSCPAKHAGSMQMCQGVSQRGSGTAGWLTFLLMPQGRQRSDFAAQKPRACQEGQAALECCAGPHARQLSLCMRRGTATGASQQRRTSRRSAWSAECVLHAAT